MHHEDKGYFFIEKTYSLLKSLGIMESNKEINVKFFDVIPNHVFLFKNSLQFKFLKTIDVQGILIQIPEYSLILYQGNLSFEAKLSGIRYTLFCD